MNFVVRSSEWLGDVDAELFLQEDEGDHPVGFSPSDKVVLIEWSDSQEFKHLIFVDVLTHVAYDVRLQFFQLEEFAKIYEVKLILVCESQIIRGTGDMLKQVLNVLIILTCFEASFVIYDDLDLGRVLAVLLTFALVYINGVEYRLIELECVPLPGLDKLVRISVHR